MYGNLLLTILHHFLHHPHSHISTFIHFYSVSKLPKFNFSKLTKQPVYNWMILLKCFQGLLMASPKLSDHVGPWGHALNILSLQTLCCHTSPSLNGILWSVWTVASTTILTVFQEYCSTHRCSTDIVPRCANSVTIIFFYLSSNLVAFLCVLLGKSSSDTQI